MEPSTSSTVGYTVALPPNKVNPPQEEVGSGQSTEDKSRVISFDSLDTEPVFAKEFYDLRASCDLEDTSYLRSLRSCKKWEAKGGKSRATFLRTQDNRFIIKEISDNEYISFVKKIAPKYFAYLQGSLKSDHKSCLAKIFGVYKGKNRLQSKYIVMENIVCGKDVKPLYDLKGKFDRNLDLSDTEHVRIEEEFVQHEGLHLVQTSKEALQVAVSRDALFLQELNITDYSLLVGVDQEHHQLVCGLIDYLVPYNTSKMFEWFAKALFLACTCTNQQPTVLNPIAYRKRFTAFIEKEFKCNIE